MNRLETLEKKVRQVAEQLVILRDEKDRLKSELIFLEEENQRNKNLIKENITLRDEKKAVIGRIEKILKKINSLKI